MSKRFGSAWAAISSSAKSMGSTNCSPIWTRSWHVNRERWERRPAAQSRNFDDRPMEGATIADLDLDLALSTAHEYSQKLGLREPSAATLRPFLRELGLLVDRRWRRTPQHRGYPALRPRAAAISAACRRHGDDRRQEAQGYHRQSAPAAERSARMGRAEGGEPDPQS